MPPSCILAHSTLSRSSWPILCSKHRFLLLISTRSDYLSTSCLISRDTPPLLFEMGWVSLFVTCWNEYPSRRWDSSYVDGDPRGIDAYGARHRDIDGAQDEVYISVYLEYIQTFECMVCLQFFCITAILLLRCDRSSIISCHFMTFWLVNGCAAWTDRKSVV